MNPSREESLFVMALDKPAAERNAFLKVVCGDDEALRQRLEALLAAHEEPDAALATAAPNIKATIKLELTNAPDEAVGQTLGRYKLLERVGEGGCGVVYVAEQTEPVRRRVALKVIKLGMDTKQVVARFEAERQALAMMDHPNIAKVLDAGTTEIGRPYFVMELVRGIKITDYCDQNQLSTKERLDLFIKVCQAIQHAHQKGIIHRDIKPSNILVTLHDGVPVPKVIDFGIAKATEGRLTDNTVYTQLHQFIGTPAYMSPEQAEMSGLDIDTRSDIYSLGVLLYELLAGSTPFDANELMASGIDQMRKTIREKDPVRPSTRFATLKGEELTTTAKRRSADKSKLMHDLKGDLDWIVMKCLEKDRTRRYETANGLAVDIRRHLNCEPVFARPPSKLYEFQKTVRRHKVGFAATAAIILILAVGIIISTWQSVRATHAKREALAAQAGESIQRQKAEANEQEAVAARANEARLRKQAEAAELAARQRAYAADMNVAKQALDASNLGRALDLLNRQTNAPGQKDLRGWEWRYLWQQTRSDALFTLCQKESEVSALGASRDGKLLAIGTDHEPGVAIWDIQARKEVAQLAPDEMIWCVAFSPTESVLAFASAKESASGEEHSTLRLWNSATRQTLAEVPLDGGCAGLSFSRDGKTLVTSTSVGQIALWQIPGLTKLKGFPSKQMEAGYLGASFAATSDLSLAAYAGEDGLMHVVNLEDGNDLWTEKAAHRFITALAFSPDGKVLASAAGYNESDIRLWDVVTGKEIGQLTGHTAWVGSIVFWPDGKRMASCSADQTLRVWDMTSRKCVDTMRGHQLEVWRLLLLPDERTLVSGCKDGTVSFWDTSAARVRRGNVSWEKIEGWQFASDNRSMLTVDFDGQVSRWSGQDFQWKEPLFKTGTQTLMYRSWLNCFSRDGNRLAVGSTNGTVSVWNVSRGALEREFRPGAGGAVPVCFLAQDTRLICWSEQGCRLIEWDLKANREIQAWPVPKYSRAAFGLTPDEKQMVVADMDRHFTARNLAERSTTNLPLDALECWSLDFSPDGKHLASASAMGFARVWENGTWREEATLRGYLKSVNSAVFSPDSQRLATGGSIRSDALRLWDVNSWQELMTLEGSGSQFGATQFSPDGNHLGTLSNDGFLHLWHAPTWAEINAAEAQQKMESKP